MPTAPDNHDAHDYAERIRKRLPRRLQELRERCGLSKYGLARESVDHGGGNWIDEGVGSLMPARFVQKNVTVGGARGITRKHELGETPSLLH